MYNSPVGTFLTSSYFCGNHSWDDLGLVLVAYLVTLMKIIKELKKEFPLPEWQTYLWTFLLSMVLTLSESPQLVTQTEQIEYWILI